MGGEEVEVSKLECLRRKDEVSVHRAAACEPACVQPKEPRCFAQV